MYELIQSADFQSWLFGLKDIQARTRIAARLRAATLGNFGDCQPVGEGVSEMRVHVGAGYRLYYTRIDKVVYFLLTGGDKSSQQKDIVRAKKMAREIKGGGK